MQSVVLNLAAAAVALALGHLALGLIPPAAAFLAIQAILVVTVSRTRNRA
jgi:hypothetical protein